VIKGKSLREPRMPRDVYPMFVSHFQRSIEPNVADRVDLRFELREIAVRHLRSGDD
jgi:hypothetical protein